MKNSGFLQIILALVIVFVILSLLGISLNKIFSNKTLMENWQFVKLKSIYLYNQYLESPISSVFSSVLNYFKELIKEQLIKGIKSL